MVFVFAVVVLGYVFWPQWNGQAPWGQAVGPADNQSHNPARLTTPASTHPKVSLDITLLSDNRMG